MTTKPQVGDIIFIPPNAKLRCWEPGCNYITEVHHGYTRKGSGDFWVTCFNPSMKPRKYGGLDQAKHYQFLVYNKQFIRSIKAGSIRIFEKKSN